MIAPTPDPKAFWNRRGVRRETIKRRSINERLSFLLLFLPEGNWHDRLPSLLVVSLHFSGGIFYGEKINAFSE